MLKSLLENLDSLPAELHEHYCRLPNGKFALETDTSHELRRALASERQRRIDAESKLGKLQGKPPIVQDPDSEEISPREKFIRENAGRLKAFEPGTPEYQAEFAKIESEMEPLLQAELTDTRTQHEQRMQGLDSAIRKATIEQTVTRILGDIAQHGCAELLKPHILNRLACNQVGDEWQVSVIDTDGNQLALSIDDLKEELRNSPAMVGIVKGADQTEQAAHARKVAAVLGTPAQ